MSKTHEHKVEQPEEVELLLPWHVTGRLEDKDTNLVSDRIAASSKFATQREQIAQDIHASQIEHEALGAPSPGTLDRLMARVAATEAQHPQAKFAADARSTLSAILTSLGLGGGSGWLRLAATAIAIGIVAQAVVIGTLLQRTTQQPSTYETATEGGAATISSGPELIVAFVAAATMDQVSTLLKDIDCTVVDGPRAGGIFRVRLHADARISDPAVLRDLLLARPDLVRFASVVESE